MNRALEYLSCLTGESLVAFVCSQSFKEKNGSISKVLPFVFMVGNYMFVLNKS